MLRQLLVEICLIENNSVRFFKHSPRTVESLVHRIQSLSTIAQSIRRFFQVTEASEVQMLLDPRLENNILKGQGNRNELDLNIQDFVEVRMKL